MPKPSSVLSFIEKALGVSGILIGLVVQIAMLLAIPIGLLYILIKPAFGPDPSEEYLSMALVAGQISLVIGGIFGLIYVTAYLASRFEVVAFTLKLVCCLLLALMAAGALVQCVSGDHQECRESRYVTC